MTGVRRAWGLLLATACGGSAPTTAPREPPVDPDALPLRTAQALWTRIEREVDCATGDVRFLCLLQEAPGEPFALPEKPHTWVGLQFALRPSRAVSQGARETLRVARLTLGREDSWVVRVEQGRTQASLALPAIRRDAIQAANGELPVVEVPLVFAQELDTRPEDLPLTLTPADGGWKVGGERPARLWRLPGDGRLPAAFVVLEAVDGGEAGALVSLFPDLAWEVPAEQRPPATTGAP